MAEKVERHYLSKLIEYNQMNATEFAKSLGTSQERINRILNLRNGISANLARTIVAKYKDVNFDWLRTGEGEMLKVDVSVKKNKKTNHPAGSVSK